MELLDKQIINKVKEAIYEDAELIKENKNGYNKLINNWNEIERLFLNFDNNYSWPMYKPDFANRFDLHLGNLTNQMVRYTKRGALIKGDDYVIEGRGGRITKTNIYENGAKKILGIMQSIEGAKFLNNKPKKCLCYITIIKYAVNGLDEPKK